MDSPLPLVPEKGPWTHVPDARRRVMQANKSRDTGPEMVVRRLLHGLGYRFRLHRRDLPGCPDLVFPRRRAVIQVHGCFWHQHAGCKDASMPRTRPEYWVPKLARNVERDRESEQRLAGLGWRVLVLWECEIADRPGIVRRAGTFLGPPRQQKDLPSCLS